MYRARDTKLGRDVAIKILPRAFTSDPDRLARFEREARVLAAPNHPNIATIHGVEENDGLRGLVMELIEGQTLADRIRRSPLPVSEASLIARQIADALEAAHAKGIVHRDLKPANVKITPNRLVKVLDFGFAKLTQASEADLTQAPTVTIGGTHEGAIVGTAAYMSPEQARGLAVDRRTDIWAFGCVLYEMLAGRPVFAGQTLTDTLAAILERQPDWSALPAATPASMRRLLQRCLEKDPNRRLRDIADARLELDDVPEASRTAARAPGLVHRKWLAAGVVLVIVVVDGGAPVPILNAVLAPDARFSWGRENMFISLPGAGGGAVSFIGKTYVVPLVVGGMFPAVPAGGFGSEADITSLPGATVIDAYDAAPGPTPEMYAYSRQSVQRNLYRIPLP